MLTTVHLSINQLADFYVGTEAKKRRIISQQKTPDSFKIAYYQLAKARIKKSLSLKGDLDPVLEGIETLKTKILTKPRQISDRKVSIEALQKFVELKIPDLLGEYDYTILKVKDSKSIFINDVEIIVSPDIILSIKKDGKVYLGAIKIHISKGNSFDRKQQSYIASTVKKYLQDVVAQENEIVMPELCLSIDIFGDGIVSAPKNIDSKILEISVICEEVKQLWSAA